MIRSTCTMAAWLPRLLVFATMLLAAAVHAEASDALGPGDSIRITVFGNPDLTTEARLASRGTIRMPLIGDVDVNNATPTEAASRIASRLKNGQFLKDPQVTVSVLQVRSRQVSVLGEVTRPGRYALEDHARLTDALALAGGVTANGDTTVSVMSPHSGGSVKQVVNIAKMYRNGEASANIELRNGDTVFVPRAPVFYIYGEVQHAGAYRLDADLNVMQAISLGGGITPRGTERGLTIRRRTPNGIDQIEVKPADRVHADDVIYVKESLF